MSDCLVLTTLADEFVAEIERLSDGAIKATACATVEDARQLYDGETVLFGSPGMIVRVIDDMPAVNWVQSSWAGVTPLINAGRRDYQLTGVKGVFGPQMAEYTLGYLLAHELKIRKRRDAQDRREWFGEHSGTLTGKTLGILGTGSIGSGIAEAASAFGMQSIGLSRSGRAKPGFVEVFRTADIGEFLESADHFVSTLPATPETDRLLNADTLAHAKPGAVFVNVGRSNVVDDGALVTALNENRLAGAVLDVFDEEPLPDHSPLWTSPNLAVTAHIAAISHPLLIVPVFVDNFFRYRDGNLLQYVVDFSTGY